MRASSRIEPPGGVNLMAFDTRLNRACLSRRSSASIAPISRGQLTLSVTSCIRARSRDSTATASSMSQISMLPVSSARYPASMVARSRMSLISCNNRCELSRMPRLYSICRGVKVPKYWFVQDLGESDDRIERRAQLVGDIRDELALQTGGSLQRLVALAQRPFDPSGVADVEAGKQHVAVGQRHRRELQRGAVGALGRAAPGGLARLCARSSASRTAGQSPASL